MRPTILAIVGASGSGKTALSEHLKEIGIESIVSFTTRDMRDGEVDGREHLFVTEAQLPGKDTMLAYAFFGGYHYWTTISQIPTDGCVSYIIDEKALIEMTEKFGDKVRILPVYIKRDNLTDIERSRRNRDKDRVILPDKYYSAVIENNGTLEEFLIKAEQTIKNLIF